MTHFERLAVVSNGYLLWKNASGLRRTRQIRVHMKSISWHHAPRGDFLYHRFLAGSDAEALHSFQLEFCHHPIPRPMCLWHHNA